MECQRQRKRNLASVCLVVLSVIWALALQEVRSAEGSTQAPGKNRSHVGAGGDRNVVSEGYRSASLTRSLSSQNVKRVRSARPVSSKNRQAAELLAAPIDQNRAVGADTLAEPPVGEVVAGACCDLQPGDRVVLLVDNPGLSVKASNLFAGATGTVLCCSAGLSLPIMVSWDGWSEGHNNDSFCDVPPQSYPPDSGWWMACDEIEKIPAVSCCLPPLQPGDRVVLLVDNPGLSVKASNLFAGATGTVLCCSSSSALPVMVSWDGWSEGHNNDSFCDVPPQSYPPDSGWWMACDEIEKIPAISCCEPPLQPGDRVELLVDNPGGADNLFAGATGTVLCCSTDDPLPIMVSWDGWSEGHDNDSYCDVPPGPYPSGSGWWMACDQIRAAPPCCDLHPGDRVMLLVDNPDNADNLLAGAMGTVLCCDTDDQDLPVMVSWDGWSEGHSNDSFCDVAPQSYPPGSGWWMKCDQIALPACGDPLHPYPPGDANRDCRVDFRDVLIVGQYWLECTAPECD